MPVTRLPRGGQLSIRISILTINASHLAYYPEARAGRFVCLNVADNGCGIAPENFEAHF